MKWKACWSRDNLNKILFKIIVQPHSLKYCYYYLANEHHWTVADLRGAPWTQLSAQKFLYFHAVLEKKIGQIIGWRPVLSSGKSLIRHCWNINGSSPGQHVVHANWVDCRFTLSSSQFWDWLFQACIFPSSRRIWQKQNVQDIVFTNFLPWLKMHVHGAISKFHH